MVYQGFESSLEDSLGFSHRGRHLSSHSSTFILRETLGSFWVLNVLSPSRTYTPAPTSAQHGL